MAAQDLATSVAAMCVRSCGGRAMPDRRAELTATDCAKGFTNRFLFVAVGRSKENRRYGNTGCSRSRPLVLGLR